MRLHLKLPGSVRSLTLPANALLFRDNTPQVAILGPDNRIVLKKVRIARDLGSEVEIAGGLGHDARIVTNPPDSIDEGEQVRVMQAAGEKIRAAPGQQAGQGPGYGPRSAWEIAQTERDRNE